MEYISEGSRDTQSPNVICVTHHIRVTKLTSESLEKVLRATEDL